MDQEHGTKDRCHFFVPLVLSPNRRHFHQLFSIMARACALTAALLVATVVDAVQIGVARERGLADGAVADLALAVW